MSIYNYAFLDENTKREIRRRILKAVAIPGLQVSFGSREMPIARGWGTGGLQVTLSIIGREDVLKVIDQGSDDSVNACNLREFIAGTAKVDTTRDTLKASIIQTRHRIPEERMKEDQILVFQVPIPEPFRTIGVEPSERETRRMHGETDYSKMWVYLYEDIVKFGEVTLSKDYPVKVNGRYIMDPSPIPRFDIPKLDNAETLFLFGAGAEKRIYAVPPYTTVKPLEFEDYHFQVEDFKEKCKLCGSDHSFLDEVYDSESNEHYFSCSDTGYCLKRQQRQQGVDVKIGGFWHE